MTTESNATLHDHETPAGWLGVVHAGRIAAHPDLLTRKNEPRALDGLLQLLYVQAGGGEVLVDGRQWPVRPPCVILVPARAAHGFHLQPGTDGHVAAVAQRPLEAAVQALAPALQALLRRPAVLPVEPDSRVADALGPLFEALEREAGVHEGGQPAAGLSLLVAMLVQVARLGALRPSGDGGSGGPVPRSRKAHQVQRFRALVEQRFRQHASVEDYAQALGLSPGQLSRLCREVLGQSALDVVNARVVHEAQRELAYSQLSVKQIAAQLGFEDEAYFGRYFRKHTGHKPTDFRAMARQRLAAG